MGNSEEQWQRRMEDLAVEGWTPQLRDAATQWQAERNHRIAEAYKVTVLPLDLMLSDAELPGAFRRAVHELDRDNYPRDQEIVMHPQALRRILSSANLPPYAVAYSGSDDGFIVYGRKVRGATSLELAVDDEKRKEREKRRPTVIYAGRANGKTEAMQPLTGVSNVIVSFDIDASTNTSLQELIDKALTTGGITATSIYGPGQATPEPPKKKARETTSRTLGTRKKK